MILTKVASVYLLEMTETAVYTLSNLACREFNTPATEAIELSEEVFIFDIMGRAVLCGIVISFTIAR